MMQLSKIRLKGIRKDNCKESQLVEMVTQIVLVLRVPGGFLRDGKQVGAKKYFVKHSVSETPFL